MTVADLKAALQDVPDETPVITERHGDYWELRSVELCDMVRMDSSEYVVDDPTAEFLRKQYGHEPIGHVNVLKLD
jgi:hypothetical protein